jgi:hypothetical protein
MMLTNEVAWTIISSNASSNPSTSGQAKVYLQSYALSKDTADGDDNNVFDDMLYERIEPFSHEGDRTDTGAQYRVILDAELTDMKTGQIVGGALSLHASVQLQSKDTGAPWEVVYSTAEATLKNIEWKYLSGSTWCPMPVGHVRLKCTE